MRIHELSSEYQKGQVLLIIVLVMIVALTIGLSVVTRSITNLQVSTEEESSQRALSAAEAGIEKALQSNSDVPSLDLGNNSKSSTKLDKLEGREFLINNGNPVLKDDGADIWLSTRDDTTRQYEPAYNGNGIRIHWSNTVCSTGNTASVAALEVLLISENGSGVPQIQHYPLDPCSSRVPDNVFCTGSGGGPANCPAIIQQATTVKEKQFQYHTDVPVPASRGIVIRVVPLYAQSIIGVTASSDLPSQGSVIESLGTSGTTQRKISAYRAFPKVPTEFFPYVLLSPQ